jgi:hypothetical protein
LAGSGGTRRKEDHPNQLLLRMDWHPRDLQPLSAVETDFNQAENQIYAHRKYAHNFECKICQTGFHLTTTEGITFKRNKGSHLDWVLSRGGIIDAEKVPIGFSDHDGVSWNSGSRDIAPEREKKYVLRRNLDRLNGGQFLKRLGIGIIMAAGTFSREGCH